MLRNPGPIIYLYQSDIYYKLGRTKNVRKRNKQIKLQLPFRAVLIHTIYTDDEIWLESYWHGEFASKRRNGEWFELDENDVARFCSQHVMPNPFDETQHKLEFLENEIRPVIVLIPEINCTEKRDNIQAEFIEEVENHYKNLVVSNPKRARALKGSRKYQIGSLDAEIERLKQQRGYTELRALQEWKRKAIMAADANSRQ